MSATEHPGGDMSTNTVMIKIPLATEEVKVTVDTSTDPRVMKFDAKRVPIKELEVAMTAALGEAGYMYESQMYGWWSKHQYHIELRLLIATAIDVDQFFSTILEYNPAVELALGWETKHEPRSEVMWQRLAS